MDFSFYKKYSVFSFVRFRSFTNQRIDTIYFVTSRKWGFSQGTVGAIFRIRTWPYLSGGKTIFLGRLLLRPPFPYFLFSFSPSNQCAISWGTWRRNQHFFFSFLENDHCQPIYKKYPWVTFHLNLLTIISNPHFCISLKSNQYAIIISFLRRGGCKYLNKNEFVDGGFCEPVWTEEQWPE